VALLLLGTCKNPAGSTPPSNPVTYDKNGAGSGSVPVDTKQYVNGAPVEVKGNTGNLERDGWAFMGWARDRTATTVDYRAGATFTFTESLTLYAVWEGKAHTISF